ncbi:uncharacterized protein LOC119437508 isoform X5 [Dermacentor silvarum]|uniref:uncharacterized protein LOC119437508 isoform X4 n=1 Tax=Dermacentor silvarum TaxID=543639 RepID=UPI00189C47E7|nr:uncharacterized protein LOC119437508 isoform X4 [Dermacentor silvarum]XP_049516587.1 uncharacterized protein LOC119437508 isoform X5 [Dermacentor silvarum]
MNFDKRILAILLLAFTCGSGSSVTTSDTKTDLFTKMLRLGTSFLKLDPMALPDQAVDFSVFGKVLLLEGSVSGLRSVTRTGSNIIRAENGTFSASIDVGTQQLLVNYTAMITAARFSHLVAYLSASIGATRMTLHLNGTDAGELQLGGFELKKFDGLKVKLEAVKHGDFLINTILNSATKLFRSVLKKTAEQMIVKHVRSSLKDINNLLSAQA